MLRGVGMASSLPGWGRNDVKHAYFTLNLVDEPVYPGDTIVLITADNNYYKVGNVVENEDFTVTFDYELMECAQ